MSNVITVDGLGKRYLLRHQGAQQSYVSLREVLACRAGDMGRRLLGRPPASPAASREEFWALKDVSFEVAQGERIGIIGRNGAGKSTLLKILSRITNPTVGSARIRGRVASLLEVGTGFHPELTGRENIFLNGAVLGMRQAEIRKKFDMIVDFAEVEKFLDTPVKRYSSGMYVRLAFAVAAHMEPEILIVDEVLAVGDAQFQKKCLGKMQDVSAREGRTVLFVTHNMQTVKQLCGRALLVDSGTLVADGPSDHVVDSYLEGRSLSEKDGDLHALLLALPRDPAIRMSDIRLCQGAGHTLDVVTGKALDIEIEYEVFATTPGLRVQIILYDSEMTPIFSSYAHPEDDEIRTAQPGRYLSSVTVPADFLAPVGYRLGVYASVYNVRHCFAGEGVIISFQTRESGRIKFAYAHSGGRIGFKIAPLLSWKTERKG